MINFVFFDITFVFLFVVFLLLVLKRGKKFGTIGQHAPVVAFLILISIVYFFLLPHVQRIYGDEPSVLTTAGLIEHFKASPNTSQSYFLHLIFKIFGMNNTYAIYFNLILAIACIFFLYVLVFLLFEKRFIAVCSCLLLAASDQFMMQASNSYTMMLALFFALTSCICFILFIKSKDWLFHTSYILLGYCAAFTRIEFIIIPAMLALYWFVYLLVSRKQAPFSFRFLLVHGALWLVTNCFLFFSMYMQYINSKIQTYDAESWLSFDSHNVANTFFYHFLPQFPPWFPVLSLLIALVATWWLYANKKILEGIFFSLIPTAFILFYLHNSYFANYYFVPIFLFLVCFAGITVHVLLSSFPQECQRMWQVLLLVIYVILLLKIAHSVEQRTVHLGYPYLSTASPKLVHDFLPAECSVLAPYFPNIGMGFHISGESIFEVRNSISQINTDDCWYFFSDYLCHIPANETGMKEDCEYVEQQFDLEPELIISMQDYPFPYVLYRIGDGPTTKGKEISIQPRDQKMWNYVLMR